MVNYQNGKIYKIESHQGDKIYIGSTTKQYLSQRLVAHRKDYTYWKEIRINKGKMRSFELFDEYGLDNCFITLIESFPCDSRDELTAREAHYIKSMQCVNKVVPMRTRQEYREDNRQVLRDKSIEYYNDNKDKLNSKITCECGSVLAFRKKSKHCKTIKHLKYIQSSL